MSGAYFQSLLWSDQPPVAPGVGDYLPPGDPDSWPAIFTMEGYGPLTDTQPIQEPALTLAGVQTYGPNIDLYNRIIVSQSRFDLGNIVSNQTLTVSIWNANYDPKTVSAYTLTPGQGITDDVPDAPYVLPGLEDVTYTFFVSTEGPASLTAEAVFTIDGVDYVVSFFGQRAYAFGFRPNWAAPVSEALEYKTDIVTHFDGTEQRIALRDKPRRSIEYDYVAARDDAAFLDNLLYGWQNRNFAVPHWPYKSALDVDADAGETRLYFDTTDRGFVAGESVMLFETAQRNAVIQVDAVHADGVTLRQGVEVAWPAGSAVYPCGVAHAPISMPRTRRTSNVTQGRGTFAFLPQQTDSFVPDEAAPATFLGKELVLKKPNWASGADAAHNFAFDEFDSGIGPVEYSLSQSLAKPARRVPWRFVGLAQIRAFRGFFARRRGMQKSFYAPTYTDDFELASSISPGATTIQVRDTGYASFLPASSGRKAFMIRVASGAYYVGSITGAVAAGGVATLSISGVTLPAIAPSQVIGFHLVNLYRLATDRVEIVWRSAGIADVDMAWIQIPS